MAVAQEVVEFVREGLARGMTRAEIARVLGEAGWHRVQVAAALDAFADVASPVPVPRPRPYVSAREAFTQLVLFATLYTAAYSFGSLVFDLIDTTFPDPASHRTAAHVAESVRWAIASLVVVVPVFLYVARLDAAASRRDPTRRMSRIRRQLTYVTLFISGMVLIGDLTTVVYSGLSGELKTRFVLKAATLLLIAGSGFFYYLAQVRSDDEERAS